MAYFQPYIDDAGLHLPSYIDIRDDLIRQVKEIYGSDIYLEDDSQDYQMISAFALMQYDTLQSALLAYNNTNPITAVGTGLDRIVALNGIVRNEATHSFCTVKIEGLNGTVITNGVVRDTNGYRWKLPYEVIISSSGIANVYATCETAGPIQIHIGGINQIVTPTPGWTSVINEVLPFVGTSAETDSQLRARQSTSGAIASRTVLDSVLSAVLNVAGVTKAYGYENDTNLAVGVFPPHSVTIVVEGGDEEEIAKQILYRKTLGCYTNGATEVDVKGEFGQVTTVRFQRSSNVNTNVALSITRLDNYNSAILDVIKSNIVKFISGLQIGEDLYISSLYAPIINSESNETTFYVTGLTVNAESVKVTVGDFEVLKAHTDNIIITVS